MASLPDVPFLCHFRRATTVTDAAPYREIVYYLAQAVSALLALSRWPLSIWAIYADARPMHAGRVFG
jgi:hypothetical protein